VPLPFDFKYYGITYNSIGLCSNGFAELGCSTHRFGSNTALPAVGGPIRLLSGFWDDLNPEANGDIYQYFDTTGHRWILEFYQCCHYDAINNLETFQIVCLDPAYYPTPTGDGEVLFLYNNVADATSNTVGIEDETETRGLQYVYDNTYDPNAAVLISGRALLVTTKPPFEPSSPWLYLVGTVINDSVGGNNNGIAEPGETLKIAIAVCNGGNANVTGTMGVIGSSSPAVVIIDSLAGFGDILVDSTAANNIEPYEIVVDSNPTDTIVGFIVNFEGNSGAYHGQVYFTMFIHTLTGISEFGKRVTENRGLEIRPNPFYGKTKIKFEIPRLEAHAVPTGKSEMSLKIYDALGRLVKSFNLPSVYSPGFAPRSGAGLVPTVVTWDGTDEIGRMMPAGVYFVRLEAGGTEKIEKAVLLR